MSDDVAFGPVAQGSAGAVLRAVRVTDDGVADGQMRDALAHRGPDGAGVWTAPGVGLGHRRLSIIDLVTGDQPVFNCDKSVIVMMNGELYNYREVRAELDAFLRRHLEDVARVLVAAGWTMTALSLTLAAALILFAISQSMFAVA